MKSLEIQTRCDCQRCNGKGNYPHPAWVAFHEAHPEHLTGQPVPSASIMKWMRENSFQAAIDVRHQKQGDVSEPREFLPSADFACGDCGGTGKTIKWPPAVEVWHATMRAMEAEVFAAGRGGYNGN